MKNTEVGKDWNDRIKSGENTYACLQPSDVLKFRDTVEVRRIVSLLKASGGKTVMEAGCGGGKLSLCLASHGICVIALDYTYPPLKNIGRLSGLLNIPSGKLGLLCGDIEKMPLQDGAFDMVLNEGVVEHWLDDGARVAVIKEMARVVRPGGLVVIYVPNGAHPFHKKWTDKGYTGYLSAPPMTLYSADKLKTEMEMAGLKSVAVDGLQAFYSFNQWPYRSWLRLPIAALNRYMKLPAKIRKTWGIHLIGIGRK